MNRVLVVLGVLALLGAGAVFLWQSAASRENGEPSLTQPSGSSQLANDVAVRDGAGSADAPGSSASAAAANPEASPTVPPTPTPKSAIEPFTRRGRVVDPSGKGVAGLSVAVVHRPVEFGGPISDSGRFVARTVTDAEGRFALSVQNFGGRPSVEWVGPLHSPTAPPVIGPAQQVTFDASHVDVELELRVVPVTSLAGRVHLDAAPEVPVDEVRVLGIGQRTGHSSHARIDAEGQFVLDLLYDETYLVVASASRAVSPLALDVPTGTSDVELTLQPVGAVRVDVEGGAPPGLRIECSRIGGEPEELARMGISGRSPQFLLPGAYAIAVYTQTMYGFVSVESIGTREAPLVVSVELAPAALVDVRNEADAPRIVIVENAGRVVRAQAIPLVGRMVLPVPPGSFTVHEHLIDGTLVDSHPLAVAASASLELVLAAPPR